MVFVI